eukprot:1156662-Pelagomonas_calceolata.AAC.10
MTWAFCTSEACHRGSWDGKADAVKEPVLPRKWFVKEQENKRRCVVEAVQLVLRCCVVEAVQQRRPAWKGRPWQVCKQALVQTASKTVFQGEEAAVKDAWQRS